MNQISLLLVLTLLLNCGLVSSQSGAASGFNVGVGNGPNANANDNANPVPAPREIPEKDMVLMTLSFGFEEGFEREPTQEEIEEILCISNDFLRQKVAESVDNSQLFAVNIDWKYDPSNGLDEEDTEWSEGRSYPIVLTFFLDATYADGLGTRIEKETVFHALDLSKEEIITFITDYVWTVDRDSIFYDCIRAHYNLSLSRWRGERTIMLPEAPNCPASRVPTISPQVPSVSPTISPAPTVLETLSPADSEDLVYFQLSVDLEQSAEELFEDPTREEVKALMCVVNSFIQDKLAEYTQDPDIATAITNIRWVTSASTERTGITLFFTTDTDLEGQDPVPTETIVQVLQDINQELLDFLHAEGAVIYLEEDEINPLLELPTAVELESLPPNYPVRTGAMDVYAEDCTAYDHTSNNGDQRGTTLNFLEDAADETSDPSGSGEGNSTGVDEVGGGSEPLMRDPNGSGSGNSQGSDQGNDGEAGANAEGSNQGGAGNVLIGEGTPTKLTIEVEFVVSNLDDIDSADDIKHLGLVKSWSDFTKNVVLKKSSATSLRGRALQQGNTPIAEYENHSARINEITPVDCGQHTVAGLTCHEVQAQYQVMARAVDIRSQKEDLAEAKRFYQVATYQGIVDGTYNSILKNGVPGTPLYIGTIPEHGIAKDDDSGMFPWWIILLLSMVILCCFCCLLAALWWRNQGPQQEEQKEEVIRTEKVFTNNPSWAPSNEDDDNTEFFMNDDKDNGDDVILFSEDSTQCQMLVPYTGGTNWKDDDSDDDCNNNNGQLVPYKSDNDSSNREVCGSSFRESMGPTRKNASLQRKRSNKAKKGVVA